MCNGTLLIIAVFLKNFVVPQIQYIALKLGFICDMGFRRKLQFTENKSNWSVHSQRIHATFGKTPQLFKSPITQKEM